MCVCDYIPETYKLSYRDAMSWKLYKKSFRIGTTEGPNINSILMTTQM